MPAAAAAAAAFELQCGGEVSHVSTRDTRVDLERQVVRGNEKICAAC